LVATTAIAVAPVAPLTQPPHITGVSPAAQLSAAVDPITPWLDTVNDAASNLANLTNVWLSAPGPVLQQAIANQIGYLSQLPDFPRIVGQVVANLRAAIMAPLAADESTLDTAHLVFNHRTLYWIFAALADVRTSPIPAELQPLVDFSTSYTSGILLGLVGPVISPILALAANVSSIVGDLTGRTPDFASAFNTLINTPAAMVDAFLNGGQSIDLTPVLNALGVNLDPNAATDVIKVGITFGGLLSPGGSIFNALDFDVTLDGTVHVHMPGHGPGLLGSVIGLSRTIAKAIGWDGIGNPLVPEISAAEPATTPDVAPRQDGDASTVEPRTVVSAVPSRALTEKTTTDSATSTVVSPDEATDQQDMSDGTAQPSGEAVNTRPRLNRTQPGNRTPDTIRSAIERVASAFGANRRHAPKKTSATNAGQGGEDSTPSASKPSESDSDE
jgi:hypothetical protein